MEKTFARITTILSWYYKIGKDFSFNDIDELVYQRKQLSIESVKLAEITGQFRSDYDSTYFNRKQAYAKAYLAEKGKTGVTAGEAEAQANISIEQINDIEKHLEGQFNKGKLILGQVNQVLSSMQQQLSYLKEEKKSISTREN